jgi:hypothetical protein
VIENLHDATATLTARVWRGSTGALTFGYDDAVFDDSGAGIANGSLSFSISGFAEDDLSSSFLSGDGFFMRRSSSGLPTAIA